MLDPGDRTALASTSLPPTPARGSLKDSRPTFLVADDHAVFRQGLRIVIQNQWPEASILETQNFSEALAYPDDTTLTLVIADLHMPDSSGPDGVRSVRRKWPHTPIMALSASEEPDDVYVALEAGASGYLSKSASLPKLIEVIEIVAGGGIFVPRDLVSVDTRPAPAKLAPRLTARQTEVLPLVAAGFSNKEIARRLNLSPGTVKAHLSAIMREYGVNNRVRLLLELRDHDALAASASSSAARRTA